MRFPKRISWRYGQRLGRSAGELMTFEGISPETAVLLGKDSNTFRDITDGFLNGSEALHLPVTKDQGTRDKLTALQTAFGDFHLLVQSFSLICNLLWRRNNPSC